MLGRPGLSKPVSFPRCWHVIKAFHSKGVYITSADSEQSFARGFGLFSFRSLIWEAKFSAVSLEVDFKNASVFILSPVPCLSKGAHLRFSAARESHVQPLHCSSGARTPTLEESAHLVAVQL